MLEVLKLNGDLREAVIMYNRSLISSCLAAYILRSALEAQQLYGVVSVIPYHTQARESAFFEPDGHPDVVDLYLVGVENFESQIASLLHNEKIRSLTWFPISIRDAKLFFERAKRGREDGSCSAGVSVELVSDRQNGNLPAVVRQWCTINGMAPADYGMVFAQGYSRIMEAKVRHHTELSDQSDLADVFYRQCIAATVVDSNQPYPDRLTAYSEQLTKFADLMQYGFDSWVAKGIESIERSRDTLKGNLLMSVMSENFVVMAPNSKDESFTLGYLLRQRYPTSRAVVLYHQQSRDKDYVYRVARGATPAHNPFEILANVNRDGRPQASVCSSIGPERVHRIADQAMCEQLAHSSGRRAANY